MLTMPLPSDAYSEASSASPPPAILLEGTIRANPVKSLATPEPIPDAPGSLTSQELREIVKRSRPPASWFEGDEEQLF
jgi:hypothetical protein